MDWLKTLFHQALNQNVDAGFQVSLANRPPAFEHIPSPWPTDNSVNSQIVRFNTMIGTLQTFLPAGDGCPSPAATWVGQRNALQAQPH
jgi:hypothetical protein